VLAWSLPASAQHRATTVNVTAGKPSEFRFTLAPKSVKHGAVTFKITNGGILPHDFKLCSSNKGGTANACAGKSTALISPGKTATLTVNLASAGSYEYMCTVSGHAAAGMKGVLKAT
jgi:uncharacterized cupredoxin-like copper-binding protein